VFPHRHKRPRHEISGLGEFDRDRVGRLGDWPGSHEKSPDGTHLGERRFLELDPPREGTINQQVRARCATGERAGDEDNTGCDLLGRSHPAGRVQIHCELEEFRVVRFDARPNTTGVIGVSGRDCICPSGLSISLPGGQDLEAWRRSCHGM